MSNCCNGCKRGKCKCQHQVISKNVKIEYYEKPKYGKSLTIKIHENKIENSEGYRQRRVDSLDSNKYQSIKIKMKKARIWANLMGHINKNPGKNDQTIKYLPNPYYRQRSFISRTFSRKTLQSYKSSYDSSDSYSDYSDLKPINDEISNKGNPISVHKETSNS